MSNVLSTRLAKLEAAAGVSKRPPPKMVQIVTRDDDEAEVYREARELGLDTSPDSEDIIIIRLIAPGQSGQVEDINQRNSNGTGR